MSLDVGTLAAYLDLDTSPLDRKIRASESKFKPLGDNLAKETKRMSTEAAQAGERVGRKLGDGIAKEGDGAGRRFALNMARSLNDGSERFAGWVHGLMTKFGAVASAALPKVAAAAALAFVVPFLGQVAAGLASGGQKIAAGLGAAIALLPAAAVAGGVALATIKIGLSGISDAFKEVGGSSEDFEEAIAGLAPPARAFMREVRSMRGDLKELRQEVQGNLFRPLVDNVRPLGERYLPVLRTVLGGVASEIGKAGSRTAGFLSQPDTALKLSSAMFMARDAIKGVVDGLPNLVRALVPVISVGSTFLPQFSEGFAGLTRNLAAAAREGERTGAIRDFIQRGLDAIKGLIDTGGTLVSIFENIRSIGSTVFDAIGLKTGNILGTVERLTGGFDKWLKSSEGTKVLATVLGIARTVLGGFRDTAVKVAKLAGDVLGPLIPDAVELIKGLSRLKGAVVDVALDALEPIIRGIGDAVGFVLPFLTDLANWLADNEPVLQGIGIAILTMLVPAFAAWALSAGAAAVATLVAMAPLIAIGVAIAALAALVIIHFDTIKRWISNVFNWVKDNWPLLLAILTGPFGLAVLLIQRNWDTIKTGVTAVKDWIVDRFNDVVSFITGLPDKIGDAADGIWDGLTGGLDSIVGWVWDQIRSLVRAYNAIPMVPNVAIPGQAKSVGSVPKRSHVGEMVPGGANHEMVRTVQGGEEILSRHDPRNARNHPSRAHARAAAGGAAAMQALKLMLQVDGTGLLENLRWHVQTIGGGDVQRALGTT